MSEPNPFKKVETKSFDAELFYSKYNHDLEKVIEAIDDEKLEEKQRFELAKLLTKWDYRALIFHFKKFNLVNEDNRLKIAQKVITRTLSPDKVIVDSLEIFDLSSEKKYELAKFLAYNMFPYVSYFPLEKFNLSFEEKLKIHSILIQDKDRTKLSFSFSDENDKTAVRNNSYLTKINIKKFQNSKVQQLNLHEKCLDQLRKISETPLSESNSDSALMLYAKLVGLENSGIDKLTKISETTLKEFYPLIIDTYQDLGVRIFKNIKFSDEFFQ